MPKATQKAGRPADSVPVPFCALVKRRAADLRASLPPAAPPRSDSALAILKRLAGPDERIIYQQPGPVCPSPQPWWLQRPQIGTPTIHLHSFRALVRNGLIAKSATNAFTPDGHCDAAYYAALGHTVYEITPDGRAWLACERPSEELSDVQTAA